MVMAETTWTEKDKEELTVYLAEEYPFACSVKLVDYTSSSYRDYRSLMRWTKILSAIIVLCLPLLLWTAILGFTITLIKCLVMGFIFVGMFAAMAYDSSYENLYYDNGKLYSSSYKCTEYNVGCSKAFNLEELIKKLNKRQKAIKTSNDIKHGVSSENKRMARRVMGKRKSYDDVESEVSKRVEEELRRRADQEIEDALNEITRSKDPLAGASNLINKKQKMHQQFAARNGR